MRKKILAGILAVVMSVTMMPGNLTEKAGVKGNVEAAVTLQNPRIETDSSMEAGQKVTYDCVWFGSYPQTEIVDKAGTCGTYGKMWGNDNDYEENFSLYTSLKNASGWDNNGDITLSGIKYRRIKQSNATYVTSTDDNYSWNGTDIYHYFRYEPIKWRILNVTGVHALLHADMALDDQKYHPTQTDITWEKSTLRSWLNGYSSSINSYGTNYTNNSFIGCAFNDSERSGIESVYLDNKSTGPYSESNGGNNTTDKIFLLSSYDLWKYDTSASYGFYKAVDADNTLRDEARRKKTTTYAKAMGLHASTIDGYIGNCYWWLRSPGSSTNKAADVTCYGSVSGGGRLVHHVQGNGVCPALYLDLSSSDIYNYAGTVCTDGKVKEETTPILNTYTVYYNANGGSGAPANQIKTEGVNISLSTTEPIRNGYTFMGWGTSSSSTTVSYSKGEIYSKDANITLYAIWKKTVTLTYDANGGSGAPSSQNGDIYNSNNSCNFTVSSTKPFRNNYTFLGWSTDNSATSASYSEGNIIPISTNTTLYAVWQETPSAGYIISYNSNGGDGAPSSQVKKTEEPLIISSVKPTRNGYEFVGWSNGSTSTVISYKPGDIFNESIISNVTLYAVWRRTITLSFNANGGSGIPSAQSATVYNETEDYTFTINNISPCREGYFFRGWGLSSNEESAVYMNGESITISADTMLYAVWEKVSGEGGETGDDDPVDPTPTPVTKKAQTITVSSKTIAINSKPASLGAKTNGNGRLTYKSSNTKVATISSAGTITVKGYGITNITINAAETSTYKKTSKTVRITVVPKKMKLKSVKSPKKGQLQIIWKKDKAADGYQIQFSRDMNFKKGVYQKAVSKKLVKLKKPVTGLISKKRYYVRMRSYKKISGKKLYGIWSYGKVIKIK